MATIFGETGLIRQPGARYAFERNGFATYDVSYKISSGDAAILEQGNEADDYSNVVLVSGSITHTGEAGCNDIRLDLHYEGKDTAHTNPAFTDDLSVDITCSVEPIDTHPAFIKFAGTRTSPLNGATFDARDGRFLFFKSEWPADSGKLNPLAGVRSYNVPIMVVSQSRIETEWPDEGIVSQLGKIIESEYLSTTIPTLSGTRNWLFTGLKIRSIGNVYFEVTKTAALSGPRLWVKEIYDPVESEP
jgi:hypothetical protein